MSIFAAGETTTNTAVVCESTEDIVCVSESEDCVEDTTVIEPVEAQVVQVPGTDVTHAATDSVVDRTDVVQQLRYVITLLNCV